MTIEGLGNKFREARRARNLTLDDAARITKIRPQRLAEIEADDFSQFPSLAYAKGFLQIYGKFLDVDVTPYLDAFEDSGRVTVDGYSYLQQDRRAKPVAAPVVRRRPAPGGPQRVSAMPLVFGVLVLLIGFSAMKLLLNVQRLGPGKRASVAQVSPSAAAVVPAPSEAAPANVASAPATPASTEARKALAIASAAPKEPEVRRAKPVTKEDLANAQEEAGSSSPDSAQTNHVVIHTRKGTYLKVTIDGEEKKPAFERWLPANSKAEFRAKRVSIRVAGGDRDAIQITKNGQELQDGDQDVTVN
jgi:cytoskeleton protein RodZ